MSTYCTNKMLDTEEMVSELLEALELARDWIHDAANKRAYYCHADDGVVGQAQKDLLAVDLAISKARGQQ